VPYIKQDERKKYDDALNQLHTIETKGQLEYSIFSLMQIYMENKEYRYSTLHDTVYAAIHAGHEFERRFLDKREDEALLENGDVY